MRAPSLAAALLVAACTGAAQAAPYVMERDPGCPCCEEWAEHVEKELGVEIVMRDRPQSGAATAHDHGVPDRLIACHSMQIEGYTLEGHVPGREIARLLRERPEGVRGLSVAGMPAGSPGMEVAGGVTQPYQVIAFGDFGERVFASYPQD
ncbi:MAG TPA: DUF411 domain-containing protein [Croceibacterium sp.]|nr:DUF411 domain-containing protein [Croceibacterium sp.]